jgi:hypothetical protein
MEVCIEEFANLNPYESRCVEQLKVEWEEAPPNIQKYFLDQGYKRYFKN